MDAHYRLYRFNDCPWNLSPDLWICIFFQNPLSIEPENFTGEFFRGEKKFHWKVEEFREIYVYLIPNFSICPLLREIVEFGQMCFDAQRSFTLWSNWFTTCSKWLVCSRPEMLLIWCWIGVSKSLVRFGRNSGITHILMTGFPDSQTSHLSSHSRCFLKYKSKTWNISWMLTKPFNSG